MLVPHLLLAGSASELDISSCALSSRYALGFAVICGAGLASLRTVLAEFFSPEDPLVQVRARSHLHTKFPQTNDRCSWAGVFTPAPALLAEADRERHRARRDLCASTHRKTLLAPA